MKRFLIVITSLSLLALPGCKDVLTEVPRANLSQANFYQSRADLIAGLNAVYSIMRNGNYYGTNYPAQLEGLTDYLISRGTQTPVSEYQGLDGTNIARTNAIWGQIYQAINGANIILKTAPGIAMADADRNPILGEARFLRALNYYNLIRNYAAVPIHTEPTEDLNQLGGKRQPVAEVYKVIITDLLEAEKTLPATTKEIGRPTLWAAKTLLADVYLTNERWAEARDKADEVILSKAYSLVEVKVSDDFERLYGASLVTTTEEIFYLKYAQLATQGWNYVAYLYPADNPNAPGGVRAHFSKPDLPLIKNWDDKDLRKSFNLFSTYPNRAGVLTSLPAAEPLGFRKYKDPNAVNVGSDCPILRYADALLIYAEAASQAGSGPTPLALERLNMVHRRAYGYPSTTASPVDLLATGLTATAFRELVLTERAYEFMLEFKRWHDLKRLGTDRLKAIIKAAKGKDVATAHLLWPIPIQEIDNNPDIEPADQNPGY
ncbi:RagB/SusD family nutrient uptake outer membrane protein [Spirosoma flavum]|uniref:RagB/SusD family nutrient uptake outer membrane protein n=1 Tax=Spirosoma flavum TaxID=2048557 RepID=A0ABW6AHT5_9BACT